jgi:hypothetical protein
MDGILKDLMHEEEGNEQNKPDSIIGIATNSCRFTVHYYRLARNQGVLNASNGKTPQDTPSYCEYCKNVCHHDDSAIGFDGSASCLEICSGKRNATPN